MAKHMKITVHIAYDEETVDDTIKEKLERELMSSISHGMLSPTGAEIVERWTCYVERSAPYMGGIVGVE